MSSHRNQKMFFCNCGAEAISVEQWDEDDPDGLINIAFWEMGHGYPPSLKERLRLIWHVIRTGRLWSDEVCLDKKAAGELAIELLRICKENK